MSLQAFTDTFFQGETANVNIRRNYLQLFDNMKNECVRLDVSIGVSLLDRNEQDRLMGRLDKVQPNIPNAIATGIAQM